MDLLKRFKIKRQKSSSSPIWLKTCSRCGEAGFRERKCDLSLDFSTFGPSVLVGARSKVVLRGKGYVWAPILWSSENSKRYGCFPTWFILWLRAILMDRDLLRPEWPCSRSQNL